MTTTFTRTWVYWMTYLVKFGVDQTIEELVNEDPLLHESSIVEYWRGLPQEKREVVVIAYITGAYS